MNQQEPETVRDDAALAACRRELAEAREQHVAVAEVLRIISRTPAGLQHALEEIAAGAARLCAADSLIIGLLEGNAVRLLASFNPDTRWSRDRLVALVGGPSHRSIVERRSVQVVGEPEELDQEWPQVVQTFREAGYRASVSTPLLSEDTPIGVITARRVTPEPFSERHVALLETFAGQATIAIEHARLFDEVQAQGRELKERNAALAEALEHQRAMGEVLQLIGRSPTDLQAVLAGIVRRAGTLCAASMAGIYFVEGDILRRVAALREDASVGGSLPLSPTSVAGIAVLEGRSVTVGGDIDQIERTYPDFAALLRRAGTRWLSGVGVPLVHAGAVVGVLVAGRDDGHDLTAAQISLVETFASQAVIAIENARLFAELQERNRELTETLAQQTAIAEVLGIMSQAPTDLERVLGALIDSAVALTGADGGTIGRDFEVRDGVRRTITTSFGAHAGASMILENRVDARTPGSQARVERRPVHCWGTPDELRAQYPDILNLDHPQCRLIVPLLREDEVIGAFGVRRDAPTPFTERQIALAETFASQAAIAVENTRLFRELQEQLEQQTATSRILEVISSSPTELRPVLDAIVESATRLTEAELAGIQRLEGDQLIFLASSEPETELWGPSAELPKSRGWAVGHAILEQRTIHIWGEPDDIAAEYPEAAAAWRRNGVRSSLVAPLLRQGKAIGVLAVGRRQPLPFTDRQIALLETFADQAVIAIENTRLFEEIQNRTRELEAASRAKSDFLSRMSHELRTPLNAIIGFAEIMEMDPATTPRQRQRVGHILQGGRHLLGLINEVLDITRIEAGRLSLSPEPVRLDAVVQEVLDLERPLAADADVTLEIDGPDAFRVAVQADRQRLRQIVLNLVANTVKYNRPGGRATLACGPGAEGRVRLTVRDTGPGIPADQIGRLFAPFERLSADASTVEGTGLGLAIARGLAEAMGGVIDVESVVGEGSAFWVELPAASRAPALPPPDDLVRPAADDAPPATATVLYIEDNQPNVELVQHALAFRPGVTLLTAPDGATGIRIARRYRPDLILLDLNLPDLQGDEVLARLHADERTTAVPVVMISADATHGQIDRLIAAGARTYLTKPLDVKRLLAIVDDLASVDGGRNAEEGHAHA